MNFPVRSLGAGVAISPAGRDFVILVQTGADITVALPNDSNTDLSVGDTYIIKDVNGVAETHTITIDPQEGTIDGSATYVFSHNYESVVLMCTDVNSGSDNGGTWSILASHKPS